MNEIADGTYDYLHNLGEKLKDKVLYVTTEQKDEKEKPGILHEYMIALAQAMDKTLKITYKYTLLTW